MKTFLLSIRLAVVVEAENEENALMIETTKVVGAEGYCKVCTANAIDAEVVNEIKEDE